MLRLWGSVQGQGMPPLLLAPSVEKKRNTERERVSEKEETTESLEK